MMGARMDADIWGRCPECCRWFFCKGWFDREIPQPCCPVCGAEPDSIVNRATQERQAS